MHFIRGELYRDKRDQGKDRDITIKILATNIEEILKMNGTYDRVSLYM